MQTLHICPSGLEAPSHYLNHNNAGTVKHVPPPSRSLSPSRPLPPHRHPLFRVKDLAPCAVVRPKPTGYRQRAATATSPWRQQIRQARRSARTTTSMLVFKGGARFRCAVPTLVRDADRLRRKTGITLKDTGVRDEHGMEPLDGIFSSPEKSPQKFGSRGGVATSSSTDMQIQQSMSRTLSTHHDNLLFSTLAGRSH